MSSALALVVVPRARAAEFGVTFLDDAGERSGSLSELWSVRFERVSPVRAFPTFRGQRNFPGLWWSATTGGHVGYESWLERDQVMLLDFDPGVVSVASQPFLLMLTFHGPRWRVSQSDPTLHAARYPQIVALTTLLASQNWQSAAQRQWPEPTDFIDQVRRDIAPGYRWNLGRHYGVRDPLTEFILEQRRLTTADPTSDDHSRQEHRPIFRLASNRWDKPHPNSVPPI